MIETKDEHLYNLPEGVSYDHHGKGLVVDQKGNPIVTPALTDKPSDSYNPVDILNNGIQEAQ